MLKIHSFKNNVVAIKNKLKIIIKFEHILTRLTNYTFIYYYNNL